MPYKHDYDKILTRLITILSRLNDGEALSVKELAEEFNVSTKTIQRDFNERLVPHFPIYQDDKKWKMQDDFRLEKINSIEDELVLDILEGIVEGSGKKFATKAKNILSKLKNSDYNPIYAKLDIEDISDKLSEIEKIESAIKERRVISCEYDFESNKSSYTLKPLKIANFEGYWYLIAMDSSSGLVKKFYLKNISRTNIKEEGFEVDESIYEIIENAISVWFDANKEPFEVRLLISQEVAKYIVRKPISKSQKIIKTNQDGSLEIFISITHKMEIIPIVKYWLPYIKILSPSDIAEEIEGELRGYVGVAFTL